MRKLKNKGTYLLLGTALAGLGATLLSGCGKKEEDMSKTPGYFTGQRVNHNKDKGGKSSTSP